MGFLDKVKGIFHSRKEGSKAVEASLEKDIRIDDIDSFLAEKDEEIRALLREKKENLCNGLRAILDNLEENVKILNNVDLSKKRAEDKLKKVTEQGRGEYISSLSKFKEDLRNILNDVDVYEVGKVNEKLEEFSKTSFKSYHKATILIGKEMERIKDDVIKIRKFENDFIKDNSELIKKEENIRNLVKKSSEKKDKEKLRNGITEDIKKIEQIHERDRKELEVIEKKINEIKESPQYKEREKLTSEKNEKEKGLKEIESELKALLDRRILEKYVHLNFEDVYAKLAQTYVKSPSKALLSDDELGIVGVFADIRKNISDGSMVLKDSDKAIEKINIGKEVFFQHQNNLLQLDNRVKEINLGLDKIRVDFGSLLNEKAKIESKMTENKNGIEALNKKQEKIDKGILDLDVELKNSVSGLVF